MKNRRVQILMLKEARIRDFFYDSLKTYGLKFGKKELNIHGLRIDIFCIDEDHTPYIIEVKKQKSRHIVGQAAQYLSIIPSYKDEICEKIQFYDIKWENLGIILLAPDFNERDFNSAKYEPLKGRIYFYKYSVIPDARKEKVFGLNLEYLAISDEKAPLLISCEFIDYSDLKATYGKLLTLKSREAKRQFYSQNILPLLNELCGEIESFFLEKMLYPHISYFSQDVPPVYEIRCGTDKKQSHRASIEIRFLHDGIWSGFNLRFSIKEGQKLSNIFANDEKKLSIFIENLQKLEKYYLWIPNTGIDWAVPIQQINQKGFRLLLQAYKPGKGRDCYIIIERAYEDKTLTLETAREQLIEEYNTFQFIFDLLK